MNDDTKSHHFWNQVWEEGVLRFHQPAYNSQMVNYFKDIDLKNKSVLIPLAGKSRDILFFLEKGAKVVAIEFVEQAVLDFFADNSIPYTKEKDCYSSENLKFYVKDFFEFKNDQKFDVLYDRASQVVFNAQSRPNYYEHIKNFITKSSLLFLAAIDHDGPLDYGPPYKIPKDEVIEAYKKMGISLSLFSEKTEVPSEKMQKAGIQSLNAYYLFSGNF